MQSFHSKQCDGILSYEKIGGCECQTMSFRLADQHSVEGIAMQPRQSAQLRNGGFIQRQWREKVLFALLRDELCGRLRQWKFA